MKSNRIALFAFVFLFITATLYRIVPERPMGFAPQIAMTIFAGLLIRNRFVALLLPLVSLLISDGLYEILYRSDVSNIRGFYTGMWQNYLLLGALTFLPMLFKQFSVYNAAVLSLISPTVYFFLSNTIVWAGGGGYSRPFTGAGWLQALADGIPFYGNSILATFFFGGILFSAHFIALRKGFKTASV